MNVIIMLSGHSQRFINEGLTIKPLLPINDKYVIDYVVKMVTTDNTKISFVCKQSDCTNYNIDKFLANRFKDAVVCVTPDNKDGPVVSLLNVIDQLKLHCTEDILIVYCDLYIEKNIISFINNPPKGVDGCIIAHSGFHPHTIYNGSFCHLKTDGNIVLDVREKGHFTESPLEEPASSGLYYFKSIATVEKYCKQLIDHGQRINNEYYITMVYNEMINDNCKIQTYMIDNYISFGVPNDYKLFVYYKNFFKIDNETI